MLFNKQPRGPGIYSRTRHWTACTIDRFTNFMQKPFLITKVVPDNLKACPRFAQHSNNLCMPSGFQVLKYHWQVKEKGYMFLFLFL